MSCQRPFSISNFHHHLQSKLTFIFEMFLIPKPPFFFLLHMLVHLTRWYFLFLPPPCQRKHLLCLFRFFTMILGSRYIDIWQMKELDRHEFINVTLPAIDIESPFFVASFFSFFSTDWSRSFTCSLPGLIGTLNYFSGKLPQLNRSKYCMFRNSIPCISTSSLLEKLIFQSRHQFKEVEQ